VPFIAFVLDVVADWMQVRLFTAILNLRKGFGFFVFCKIMQGYLRACLTLLDPNGFHLAFFSFVH
jgi:hypothetical protein